MGRLLYFLAAVGFGITLIIFVLYSYTQIDLNLTLSGNPLYQEIQNRLIYIGYFDRPLSTVIYIACIFILFGFFFYLAQLAFNSRIELDKIIIFITISVIILFLAYPAFSHDFFNYLFDARIVTYYQENPYIHKASDFPDDLWIRFMHWTHRTYPYGHLWLLITLPFSYIGAGKFVLTLFLFKLMFISFHLGNLFLIYRIASIIAKEKRDFILLIYGLNPFILVESVVSPHNEAVMLFFLLLSIYLFLKKNILGSLLHLSFSILVKFVTLAVLPCFVWGMIGKISSKAFLTFCIFALSAAVVFESFYREAYPWYFLMPIGVGTLLAKNRYILLIISTLSISLLLRYVPFLFQGSYTQEGIAIQNGLLLFPLLLIIVYGCRQGKNYFLPAKNMKLSQK